MPLRVAPREETRGALADRYDVPTAEVRRSRLTPIAVVSSVLIIGILSERHIHFIWANPAWRPLLALWVVSTSQFLVQWFLSYRDRPVSVTPAQQRALDQLRVVVNVPVYNEDPAILDRALWALVNQTRPPDCIDVVDDGSTEDYSALRQYWAACTGAAAYGSSGSGSQTAAKRPPRRTRSPTTRPQTLWSRLIRIRPWHTTRSKRD